MATKQPDPPLYPPTLSRDMLRYLAASIESRALSGSLPDQSFSSPVRAFAWIKDRLASIAVAIAIANIATAITTTTAITTATIATDIATATDRHRHWPIAIAIATATATATAITITIGMPATSFLHEREWQLRLESHHQ